MAIKAINNWLNGSRNYTEGVELYTQYGDNQVYKRLFAQSQNPFTEQKLHEFLTEINVASAPADELPLGNTRKRKPTTLAAFEIKEKNEYPVIDLTTAPDGLKKLDQRRKQLFQQAITERERISSGYYRTADERLEALKIIHANFHGAQGIQAIWKRIDYWKDHGRFIPFAAKGPDRVLSEKELLDRRNTLRTYVTRYKNKPDKKHFLEKYELELIDVEQKLMDYDEA